MTCLRPKSLPVCLLTAILLIPFAAFAQQTNTFESLKTQYQTVRQKIESDALATYSNALTSAMAQLKQKGDFDNYLVLDAERKTFEITKSLPEGQDREELVGKVAGMDALIKKVAIDRNAKIANLLRQYIAVLDRQVKALLLADKIEEGKAVNAAMDTAKSELADLEAKLSKELPKQEQSAAAKSVRLKKQRTIVLWNTHNGRGRNAGTLTCNIFLAQGSDLVWEKKKIRIPWGQGEDEKVEIEVPNGKDFTRIRVEITKWMGACGGLNEIQVMENGTNIALHCRTEASGSWNDGKDPHFLSSCVTDGITLPPNDASGVGYWLLPGNTPGWVEVDLTEKYVSDPK